MTPRIVYKAQHWQRAGIVVGIWMAVGAFFLVQQYTGALLGVFTPPDLLVVYRRLAGAAVASAFTPGALWLARRYRIGGEHAFRNMMLHVGAGSLVALAGLATLYALSRAGGALAGISLGGWLATTFHEGLAGYAAVVGAIHLADAYHRTGKTASGAATETAPAPDAAVLSASGRSSGHLLLKLADRSLLVSAAEVAYAEADGHHVRLRVGHETHRIRSTLHGLEARLDPAHFVRIHRSALVNLEQVRELRPWFGGDQIVVMRDGRELRLSRRYADRLAALAVHGSESAE